MGSLVDVMVKKGEKAKGFNRSVLRGIRYKKCVDVLFDGKSMRHVMKPIQMNLIELELIIFLRFHCLVLMLKDTREATALTIWHIFRKA